MSHHGVARAMGLVGLLLSFGGAWGGEDGDVPNSTTPPFLVSGTIISPPSSIALVVILNEQGQALGELRLHEGEAVNGYRIAKIHMDQVIFERNGQGFPVRVGNAHLPTPTIVPVVPYERRKERPATFGAPPDNIEDIRRQTETFMRRLGDNPEFQKGLEEVKRRFQERLDTPKANP